MKKDTANSPDQDAEDKTQERTPGEGIREWWQDFLNLKIGSDRAGAVAMISSGNQMRGSNAWMLVCSILIASLGLNLNSGAVIIGAMLISPLMNPILGVGLGVGTNDWPLLEEALRNFGIAIAIALTTSVLYFLLTPIDNFTEQMASRTEPTSLDALVAVFGGLAGIISVTRKEKTNAIPGVAIATALMPPLCVAGYGVALAITDPEQGLHVFWRSFYLFFINSFFIAVTAYVIIRLLRFPYRKYLNKGEARRSMAIVLAISILMVIPSVYILRDVVRRDRDEDAARRFTENYFPNSLSTYRFTRSQDNTPLLSYPIKTRMMSADSIEYYTNLVRSAPYNIKNARIVTDTSLVRANLQSRQAITSYDARLADLEYRHQVLAEQVVLQEETPDVFEDSTEFMRLYRQFKLAFPETEALALSMARVGSMDSTATMTTLPLAMVTVSRPGVRPTPLKNFLERQDIAEFIKLGLGVDSVLVVLQEI